MIEILSTIGEVCCIGIGLVLVFSLLAFLFSNKSGFPIKALIPVFGGFSGVCMGAFLGNLVSDSLAVIGAVVLGIAGFFISISAID